MARRAGMTEGSNPVTVALTGHLSGYLLLAAVLTWPIAMGLLRLYTRSVRRSMRRAAPAMSGIATSPLQAVQDTGHGTPTSSATLHDLPGASTSPAADLLLA